MGRQNGRRQDDRLAFAGDKSVRWIIKAPQRMSRWPYKLKRRLARRKNK